jgi:hypothetical protein
MLYYQRFIAANQTQSGYVVNIVVSGANQFSGCSSPTGTATITGNLWNVEAASSGYCMSLATLPVSFVGIVNTADIGAYLISIG